MLTLTTENEKMRLKCKNQRLRKQVLDSEKQYTACFEALGND